MTPRNYRRLQKRLAQQMELERNGAPIPGDIAARMTKPKDPDQLYQLWAEVRGQVGEMISLGRLKVAAGTQVPLGPKAGKDFCEALMVAINGQIAMGKEKILGNPQVLPCVILS